MFLSIYEVRRRDVTMTVYAIEADQLDVTLFGQMPGTQMINGYITIKAQGGGDHHSWRLREGERHYWPGDTVTVTLVERVEGGGQQTQWADLPNPEKYKT